MNSDKTLYWQFYEAALIALKEFNGDPKALSWFWKKSESK